MSEAGIAAVRSGEECLPHGAQGDRALAGHVVDKRQEIHPTLRQSVVADQSCPAFFRLPGKRDVPLDALPAAECQRDKAAAAVGGMPPPLDVTSFLELVDQLDGGLLRDAEVCATFHRRRAGAVRQEVDGEPVRTADVAEAVGGELLVDLVHHRADAHREHGRQVAWGRGRFSYFDK